MFPLISEKSVEAVRNCEQLKRREQEQDNVTMMRNMEKQHVEALEVVEKEREHCGAGESCVRSVLQTRSFLVRAEDTQYLLLMHCLTHRAQEGFT